MPQSGFIPDNSLPYMVPVVNKEEVSPLGGTAVFSGRLQEAAQSSVSFLGKWRECKFSSPPPPPKPQTYMQAARMVLSGVLLERSPIRKGLTRACFPVQVQFASLVLRPVLLGSSSSFAPRGKLKVSSSAASSKGKTFEK